MKNRFAISRCCCNPSGAGTCPDSCVYTFNGCSASALGEIYTSLADAFNNCGWFQSFLNQVITGVDGDFLIPDNFLLAPQLGQVRKWFNYDYRTTTTRTLSYTSTVLPYPANPGALFGVPSNRCRTRLLSSSGSSGAFVDHVSTYTDTFANPTIQLITPNVSLDVDAEIAVEIQAIVGDVVSTTTTDFQYVEPDTGNTVTVSGCKDIRFVDYTIDVDGVEQDAFTTTEGFIGKICEAAVQVELVGSADPFRGSGQTSGMTITTA